MEEIVTMYELYQAIQHITELLSEDEAAELMRQQIEMTTNGNCDTDTEILLQDIKDSLQYNEDYTALQEISSRLEVIDTRIDKEAMAINSALGVIGSVLLFAVSTKFIRWLLQFLTTG